MQRFEFLEWADALSQADWQRMHPDVFRAVTDGVALAYASEGPGIGYAAVCQILQRVYTRAQADINAGRREDINDEHQG